MRDLVGECERRIAEVGGAEGAVVCSRATVGLAGVLGWLGLEKGSGVVVPVMCCANVVYAIRGAGLRPVFADVEVQRGGIGMSMGSLERVADEGCRVLLVVPLFGGTVDEVGLRGFAERRGLVVVEDGAQEGVQRMQNGVQDSRFKVQSGSVGGGGLGAVCRVVSFGVGKVGDAGGGGAVLSDDLEFLERLRGKKGLGGEGVDCGRILGMLDGLEGEVERRLERAAEWKERLLGMDGMEMVGEVLPVWKFSMLVRDRGERDRLTRMLVEKGVEVSNLYPPLSRWFGGVEGEGYEGAWGIWRRIVNVGLGH